MPSSQNDFAPPDADVTPPEQQTYNDHELASRDQRAVGLILDLLITYPMMLVLVALPELLGLLALLDINLELSGIARLMAWLVFLFVYYLMCEGLWHRTIGKMIAGTRVIDESGRTPGLANIIKRTLVRFIPLEFITYMGNTRPVGWHDRWSNTRVVNHNF